MAGDRAAGAPSSSRRRMRYTDTWRRHKHRLIPYLFIAPNIALFTAFSFLPLIYAVYTVSTTGG
jgi:ABC-type sugar transport system permease subunit